MAGAHDLIWSRTAELDLLAILETIAQDRPAAAQRAFERIRASTTTLSRFPARGRRVPELARHGLRACREIVAAPWRVVYRVDRECILVVAVIDGRRDVEHALLERLLRP